ncbi:MAG TPA: hypothetical protein VMM18_11345 [Gemmatimonadaceae bacterium]|nr:hypothetical protein [Gemmatimonadaceae bacterium]
MLPVPLHLDRRPAARVFVLALAAMLFCGAAVPSPGDAQRIDTVRVGPDAPRGPSPVPQPPISPRRAFLSSLAVPGLGQTALDRGVAGAIFVTAEFMSIAMIRKSLADLRIAKAARDSIVVGYQRTGEGLVVLDSLGRPIPVLEPDPLAALVSARRSHLEDWIALLLFNHFFAGADAYVAAHLWEVPVRLSARPSRDGVAFGLELAW